MSDKFGWAFIGTGTLAKNVAEQILPSGRHSIVSVYSRNPERREAFAKKYGAAACQSAAEAIGMDGVDGVYIVTTHRSHYEYSMLALNSGKPVLCEKPMTVSAPETEAMFALAREKKLYLAEAMWTWFSPIANRVKKWLDDGEFGEIREINLNGRFNSWNYAPRVTDPAEAGGALLDIGVYSVEYLYHLFGKPERVICRGSVENGIDWEEEIDLIYPDGAVHHTSASIRTDDPEGGTFTVKGSKATLKLEHYHYTDYAKLVRNDGTCDEIHQSGDYLNEFDLVAEEIRNGAVISRYAPPDITIGTMRILDECRRQIGLRYPFESPLTK